MQRVGLRTRLIARNIGSGSSAALLTIRTERDDLVGRSLDRGPIHVSVSPWIVRNDAAFQVRAVPLLRVTWPLHQRDQAVAGARITAHIEVIEVERAGEALDLDFCRLDLGLAEIIEHARADDRHDQADDGDDHEYFHEREAGVAPTERRRGFTLLPDVSHVHRPFPARAFTR